MRSNEYFSDLPDPALVERVAQGDRSAFLELYDRHVSRVFALATRMLGDRASAEEVTQDVLMKETAAETGSLDGRNDGAGGWLNWSST